LEQYEQLGFDHRETKKADVAEHPGVFYHVGLLVNEPSSYAGMLFIKSSDDVKTKLSSQMSFHLTQRHHCTGTAR
jgi:hypothetical protein